MEKVTEIMDTMGRGGCLAGVGCLFLLWLLVAAIILSGVFVVGALLTESIAGGVATAVGSLVVFVGAMYVIYQVGKRF